MTNQTNNPTSATKEMPSFDNLWNYRDPEGTRAKMLAKLPEVASSGDPTPLAELLTQIARTHSLKSEFDQAFAMLEKVEPLLEDAQPSARVRYLLEKGRTYNSSKKKAEAIELFDEAFSLASSENLEFYKIDAAHMLGIAHKGETQLMWNEKTISLCEKSQNEKVKQWLGPLLNNTGWSYFDLKRYDEAMEFFVKSKDFREERNDSVGAFIGWWTIARCHRARGENEEALQIQLSLKEQMLSSEIKTDGYVFEELGELYLLAENHQLAAEHFAKAYELISKDQWMMDNEAERMARMKSLAK